MRSLSSVPVLVALASCAPDDRESEHVESLAESSVSEEEEEAQVAEDLDWLAKLGYVDRIAVTPALHVTEGVSYHDSRRTARGLNLFNARHESEAVLMTMDGRTVHRWSSDVVGKAARWLERWLPSYAPRELRGWNHVLLLPDGDLLAIGSQHMLLRLDWDSKVLWKRDLAAHHDVRLADGAQLVVLTDGLRSIPGPSGLVTVQDNYVVVLDHDGQALREYSLLDAFGDDRPRELVRRLGLIESSLPRRLAKQSARGTPGENAVFRKLYGEAIDGELVKHAMVKNLFLHGSEADVLHANSVQVLTQETACLWAPGDLLVSIRELDLIAVIDHRSGRVVWTWGEHELERQHHATSLDDGTILIFDNGSRRGWSRLLRMDPREERIVWEYTEDPRSAFFSAVRGGAEPLSNGNVLAAETNRGRAFEVTPAGEVVWEFFSPLLGGVGIGRLERGALYRMGRIVPEDYGLVAKLR